MARTRSLSTVASLLSDIATTFDVAVVVINQMTTKFGGYPYPSGKAQSEQQQQQQQQQSSSYTSAGSRLVPALGESWAHATTTRLVLSSSSLC